MFEPESHNLDCPECLRGRIYYDRPIGFYCMPCGHEFSLEEIIMLIIRTEITSLSKSHSDASGRKPMTDIKELPPLKTNKVEPLTRDVTE